MKMRLDLRAAREGHDRLDAAVRAAYGRAAEAAAETLKDRGDYLVLKLTPARFTWAGAAFRRLDPIDRAAVETVIDRAIQSRVATLLDRPALQDIPELLQDGEGAVPEPDRMLPGSYLAPSYETKSEKHKEQLVFVLSEQSFAKTFPSGYRGELYRFTGLDALNQAFTVVLRSALAQGLHPPHGILGCLYLDRHGKALTHWIGLCRYAGDPDDVSIYDHFVLGDITTVSIKEGKVTKPSDSSIDITGVASYARVASGGDMEASLERHLIETQKSLVDEEIASKKLSQTDAAALRADIASQLRSRVADIVKGAKQLNPHRALCHVRFRDGGGGEAEGPGPDVFENQTSINVYPIVRAFYSPRKSDDGKGGQAGRGKTGKGGGAGGAGADGSGGDSTGSGEGGEGKPAGGGSEEGDEAGTSARFVFPQGPSGDPIEIDLGPLNGELSFDELGAVGVQLRDLMKRIAFRLQMPEGEYPGSFLMAAAQVWGGRAASASGFEGVRAATLSEVAPESDNSPLATLTGPSAAGIAARMAPVLRRVLGGGSLGDVDFQPADSPVLKTMRHLGGTVPIMTAMSRLLWDAYQDKANASRLGSYYKDDGVSWYLHFLHEYSPAIRDSIAFGFKVACKSILIQLCLSSRHEILLRLNNFERYAPLVETMLVHMLAPQAALTLLRKALMDWLNENRRTTASTIASGYASWRSARQAMTAALDREGSAAYLERSKTAIGEAWSEAKVELGADDVPRVRDNNGRLWTLQELDQAIALGTGTAQAIDPLVRKIADLPQAAVMAKADPVMLRSYLKSLLNEMLAGNTKITSQAEGSAEFAFRASKINEDIANASVPGTTVVLGGLHLLAHRAIGDSFLGDARYAEGLDYAFSAELGRQGLTSFFEFTGVMFLSVVCPPLGAAAGAMVASVHVHQAQEKMDMLKGLMDEDKVMSLADAELDLFLAELETVFAFIPIAGKALKLGAKGGVAIVKSGARAGAKKAFQGLAKEVSDEMAQQLKYGLVVAFMKELASDQVVGQLVQKAIEPAIKALMHEIDLTVGAGTEPGTSTADEAIATSNMQRLLDEEGSSDKAKSEGAEIARKGSF
ncbi:hypothetical protein CEJ86_29050 [Sinorhizobium meliloti]|uniref:Uncharacterized protein n=2 Tax=Rhizobium meliloti TaxID=382 RepID=A0A2J0YUW3_RHIML|nr:hypothetical protein CEJ86_29050 [Sinorhizobium meliloti]